MVDDGLIAVLSIFTWVFWLQTFGARYIFRKNHWQTKVSASVDQEQYASLLISFNFFLKNMLHHLQAWAYTQILSLEMGQMFIARIPK